MTLAALPIDARTAILVLCGLFFVPHTIAKLSNIPRSSQLFEKIKLRPAPFFVVFTSAMELVAAFGMVTGLYPRLGAAMAATILFVAAYAIAQINGLKWRWQHPGIEYMIFWGLIGLCAAFLM